MRHLYPITAPHLGDTKMTDTLLEQNLEMLRDAAILAILNKDMPKLRFCSEIADLLAGQLLNDSFDFERRASSLKAKTAVNLT
jgi:hypothetical protein